MGFAKDVLGFEAFNLKGIGKKIKDNPARLLYGGIDPASTKVWNTVLGRDDDPLVDQWGGASADTYTKANEAGINTKPGHTMHRIARTIAAYNAGSYGADSAGLSMPSGGSGLDYAQMGQGLQIPGPSKKQPVEIPTVSDYTPDMPEYQSLLSAYNSNEGPYADGYQIHVADDGNAYLLGQDYSVLGRVPADNRLYSFLNSMGDE